MAILKTTNGAEYRFDAQRVTVVAADPSGASTSVTGITEGVVHVAETPTGFLGRLKIDTQFAELTRPDNSSVWIRANTVAYVRAPVLGEYSPNVQAVVNLGGGAQAVIQSIQEAVDRLNRCGANL